MTKFKLSHDDAVELYFEEEFEISEGITLTVVEEGDWEQDDKFQQLRLIFTDGKKHYAAWISRSGSPFTDWHYEGYDDDVAFEVEKREVTVTRWEAV